MLKQNWIHIILLSLILFWSCERKPETVHILVAEVGESKLYASDVAEVVPYGIPSEDSLMIAEDYINKWIKRQLLRQKAEENLTLNQKDLTRELEEYRNSLIIYRYKNELMKEKMDTSVNEQQIQEYYETNKDDFKLTRNIVKAIYIKIPEEFANPSQLKEMCSDPSEQAILELRDYCIQYAKKFDIFTDHWIDFDMVVKNLPKGIEDPARFLQTNSRVEMKDGEYYYLVSIIDYKLKNELAPMEFVSVNIKNLILNRRKIEFLKEVENNVYTEGIRNNKFKIYNTGQK